MALGKIESVDIRTHWKNEEYDFTPWLARDENIQVLEPVMHFEEVIDYRVGQVVLHSTQ